MQVMQKSRLGTDRLGVGVRLCLKTLIRLILPDNLYCLYI